MKRKLPNDAKRDELGYMKENLRVRENKEKKVTVMKKVV